MTKFNWKKLFQPGHSIYTAMFSVGVQGVPRDDVNQRLMEIGVDLRTGVRPCDDQAYKDGYHEYMRGKGNKCPLYIPLRPKPNALKVMESKLSDFDTLPPNWSGTSRRYFPCKANGSPARKWGYSDDFTPTLYTKEEAIALANPHGYIGQNIYAQPFIVIDIDGNKKGVIDQQVVDFGMQFAGITETWFCPEKQGSFHIYLSTQRIIPIAHFSYAKVDLMGNQRNAAVYMKNKYSNGIPRAELTDEHWEALKQYTELRKQQRDVEEGINYVVTV